MIRSKKVVRLMCMLWMISILLSGCSLAKTTNDVPIDKEFFIDYYNISLTATQEWLETEQSNFDIQLTNGDAYFSVMAYYTIDLPAGDTPESIYEWQNEDLFSRRDNVEVVEPAQIIESDGKTITATLYSAERDETKNYYYSCLVEFDDNDDVFAWIIVTAYPSYMVKNQDSFLDIMKTMEYEEEKQENVNIL